MLQFLPVPELIPIRLTNQILNLLQPHGQKGLLEGTMIHSLRALRRNCDLLLSTMDVFVKEPSLDWQVRAPRNSRLMDFRPQINQKSRNRSTRRSSNENFTDRSSSKIFATYNLTEIEPVNLLALPSRKYHDFNDFFNRQNEYLDKVKDKNKKSRENFMFKPEINKNSSIIVESSSSSEPLLKKMGRLSQDGIEKIKRIFQVIRE